ncbi:MAG: hypothetical protein U1C58_00060, partial [Flavobacteriaceae bacterium]|nr:hypothetical protein [Flavobacteriaceae bacterium]
TLLGFVKIKTMKISPKNESRCPTPVMLQAGVWEKSGVKVFFLTFGLRSNELALLPRPKA